ncbi:hypothetical protein LX76_03979 [Cereibacter changlensis]|uniref:Uncharacterized protein n=1 Tax=Cereibacter changlensis TaxID=402884 RepID=A0A2W7QKX9_9RHOB|nr:hypothetical protein LX76_03979 [Cereibacter changlensis]
MPRQRPQLASQAVGDSPQRFADRASPMLRSVRRCPRTAGSAVWCHPQGCVRAGAGSRFRPRRSHCILDDPVAGQRQVLGHRGIMDRAGNGAGDDDLGARARHGNSFIILGESGLQPGQVDETVTTRHEASLAAERTTLLVVIVVETEAAFGHIAGLAAHSSGACTKSGAALRDVPQAETWSPPIRRRFGRRMARRAADQCRAQHVSASCATLEGGARASSLSCTRWRAVPQDAGPRGPVAPPAHAQRSSTARSTRDRSASGAALMPVARQATW